jgi:anti-anti-sigma factor
MRVDTIIDGATIKVKLSDRMTFSDHAVFRGVLQKIEQSGARSCIFDLSDLESIDSAGLGMFIIAKDAAQKQGWSLSIRKPTGHVKSLFELGRFDKLLAIES